MSPAKQNLQKSKLKGGDLMNVKNSGRKRKLMVVDSDRNDQKERAEAFKDAQSELSDIQTKAPKHLDNRAQWLWRSLVPDMQKMGVLKQVDKINLETLCTNYSIYRDAEEEIQNNGSYIRNEDGEAIKKNPAVDVITSTTKTIKSLCTELGLSFNSRSIQLDAKEKNNVDEKPAFRSVKF